MAAELPVIATRVGGIPEIVTEGETGLLVPPADANALANAVRTLLAHPDRMRRMGERGRDDAMSRFSTAAWVSRLDAVYQDVLKGQRS
jgi:glycosyltransferase involved in cell wall biosynthesis